MQVLIKRFVVSIHGSGVHKGLSYVAFTLRDDSRILFSDTHGVVNVWDRRLSELPCLELTTNSSSTLNSIQLDVEEQIRNTGIWKILHAIHPDSIRVRLIAKEIVEALQRGLRKEQVLDGWPLSLLSL
ncbi:hypothetical protein POM88_008871 [Heracleum sosnowskyi]|uniref:Uncharacterized protein n=1 Tax=Heracleum sosnowskyi TaxID=360622 RepID=A0AAD8J816_9APIA|nr:hypothetical protein POM88_008871 [Heracleum sosnowskyi]